VRAVVEHLDAQLFHLPLPRPWGPGVPEHSLVRCDVQASDGRTGVGFTWTPSIGGRAVIQLLLDDCRGAVVGGPTHPAVVADRLWRHLHEAGSGGLTSLARTAVDTALWDLDLKSRGIGLTDALGRRRDAVPAYGSGVNYDASLTELQEQTARWVQAGYPAVKVKVGHPNLDEDIARIEAVRRILGPNRRLMIDANQRWTPPQARRAITALARFDLTWVEEPLLADDISGHRTLREQVEVPLALGENQRTLVEFRELLTEGACDFLQPNLARIGGVTPFLQIAALAAAFNTPVFPHHLPEISGQLAMCLPTAPMVEDIEDASFTRLGILDAPAVTIRNGQAQMSDHHVPGLGLGLGTDHRTPIAPLPLSEATSSPGPDAPAGGGPPPATPPLTTITGGTAHDSNF